MASIRYVDVLNTNEAHSIYHSLIFDCFLEEQLPPLPIAVIHLEHSFNQHMPDSSRLAH